MLVFLAFGVLDLGKGIYVRALGVGCVGSDFGWMEEAFFHVVSYTRREIFGRC